MTNFFTNLTQLYTIAVISWGLTIPSCSWLEPGADDYFRDDQIVELVEAATIGDTQKIEELVKAGANVNYVGKNTVTPLYWLMGNTDDTPAQKKGFQKLLELGANPIAVHKPSGWTVLHASARYKDPSYLKIILEEQPNIELDFEKKNDAWGAPILQASLANRYENFEILLNHGANIEQKNHWGDTPLDMVGSNGTWKFAYLLLQKGADYKGGPIDLISGRVDDEPDIIWSLENLNYWPSVATNYRGTDYRQKVVEFLREKGVEVNPSMPEDEEYRLEDGEYILYIKEENGEWVEFKKSSKYKK